MKNLLAIGLLFLIPYFVTAQKPGKNLQDTISVSQSLGEVSDTVKTADFFEIETPLKVRLKYDISSFVKNKTKGEYLDAELTVNYDEANPITKNIRIQARGNFRRGQCMFPPFFLNFKTDPLAGETYADVKKVKVVTHCSSSTTNQSVLLREYLAYKLYNILTDRSFRVRLLDIDYIDTGKKQKKYRSYGFIIEPADIVAKRNNGVIVESMAITGKNLIEEDADRAALFQYMISNTDWRIKSGHNTKFMKSLDVVTDKLITLPYDFDFSGFVDASYSFPQEWSDTKSIFERDYLGYCRESDETYFKNIELFKSKKDEILKTINSFDLIPEKERKETSEFIMLFFDELNDPQSFIKSIKRDCRTLDF